MAKKYQQNYLSNQPLAYMGVEPSSPLDTTVQRRAPTVRDTGFAIGTFWLQPTGIGVWMLVNISQGSAVWVPLYPNSGAGASSFPTNSGTATSLNGVLNMLGSNVVTTSGAGNTVSISLVNGTNGQILIGGGSNPAWENITSNDGSVSITNGPNSINLEVSAAGVNTVGTNSGTATASGNSITLSGANILTTSASGNTVTVAFRESTNGKVPIAATSGATAYANITSLDSSLTITNGPNSIDIIVTGGGGGGSKPNFFYYQASNSPSLTPGIYFLGTYEALTKVIDTGNNVYPGDGSGTAASFTAPVDGVYLIGGGVNSLTNIQLEFFLVTTSSAFGIYQGTTTSSAGIAGAVLVNLSASDTVKWEAITGLSGIINGGTQPYYTWIYGYLVAQT
jgi:hypothetical protein